MTIFTAARRAAFLLGSSVLVAAAPALAQQPAQTGSRAGQPQQGQQAAQPERRYELSRAEQRALQPLIEASRTAEQSRDWAPVQAMLPAAQAAARGNDARYIVTKIQYSLARGTNNIGLQEQALSALATNPATPAEEATMTRRELDRLKNVRAEQAFAANDFATAERLFLELQQANPGDTRIANNLSIVRTRMGNTEGALEPVLQQIRTAEASGGRAEEALYRRARDTFYRARDVNRSLEYAGKLARHYPTTANWRDAIAMYRQLSNPGDDVILATYRLQRATNSLQGEADYLGYAQLTRSGGFAGETKAVIDAGIAANAFTRQRQGVPDLITWADENAARDRTGLDREAQQARAGASAQAAKTVGDALFGYGRYAEAADLYRAALTKTGANRDILNLHLGAALAMANQRAEAETALRAVTGPSAGLAALWLAYAQRQG